MTDMPSEVDVEPVADPTGHDRPRGGDSRPPSPQRRLLYTHSPHPHIAHRKKNAPADTSAPPAESGPVHRFNTWLALKITQAVGTMWCAYLFAALALVSLPSALQGGIPAFVAWLAQTFLQLVLLSIIIVGQKVEGASSERRAIETYNDAEAILHESVEIQNHLAEQDRCLQHLIDELVEARAGGRTKGPEGVSEWSVTHSGHGTPR